MRRTGTRACGRRSAQPLLILMAIAAGVLFIVCANVANLLIARGTARRREMALRLAVGGSRWQIARLLLVESLVLSAAGTAAGLLIASWGADALLGFYESPDAALADPLRSRPAHPVLRLRHRRDNVARCRARAGGARLQGRSRHDAEGQWRRWSTNRRECARRWWSCRWRSRFSCSCAPGSSSAASTTCSPSTPVSGRRGRWRFRLELEANGYDAERARGFARTLQQRVSRIPGVSSSAYTFQSLLGGGAWGTELHRRGVRGKARRGRLVAGECCQSRLLQGDGYDARRRPRVHRP